MVSSADHGRVRELIQLILTPLEGWSSVGMPLIHEYLDAFYSADVAFAALLLLCLALPLVLMVWAMVRNQHREMEMHYCPSCGQERPYERGGSCPHCHAPVLRHD